MPRPSALAPLAPTSTVGRRGTAEHAGSSPKAAGMLAVLAVLVALVMLAGRAAGLPPPPPSPHGDAGAESAPAYTAAGWDASTGVLLTEIRLPAPTAAPDGVDERCVPGAAYRGAPPREAAPWRAARPPGGPLPLYQAHRALRL